jgi:predicted acylesterase/phospholipase RssA
VFGVVVLALGLALGGCGATRPAEDVATSLTVPDGSVPPDGHVPNGWRTVSTPPGRIAGSGPYHILALSGGGSYGAFGAGVMKGWTESGSRPNFDVVTGVSTGALIAVFAFLGPAHDEELRALYTETSNADIYAVRGLAGLFGDSLLDDAPLKHRIDEIIDEAKLDRIAAEHRKGRRLYVGSTNLDAGRLVIWDIGAIAATGLPERGPVIHKILRASASIPAAFKPVYIQPTAAATARQMHVDGGVKAPLLVRDFMLPRDRRRAQVWVVVNGDLKTVPTGDVVAPSVLQISKKSIEELLRVLLNRAVEESYRVTTAGGGRFRLTELPDDVKGPPTALDFEPEAMKRLYASGRDRARRGVWQSRPPSFRLLD